MPPVHTKPTHAPTWSQGLEGAGLAVAATDHSPLRVLAGPGSGKTFALIRRVARLLESGADPFRMLVCTFTRTAAADLVRALGELGIAEADRVIAGTIHSSGNGLDRNVSGAVAITESGGGVDGTARPRQ